LRHCGWLVHELKVGLLLVGAVLGLNVGFDVGLKVAPRTVGYVVLGADDGDCEHSPQISEQLERIISSSQTVEPSWPSMTNALM